MPPSETVVEGVVVEPVIPGPDHNIEIGVEVDDILIGTKVFVQVIELVTGEAVTDGKPALAKTCTVDVVIQPVIGLMACNVNIPADEAVVMKLVAEPLTPPSQLAVVPAGAVALPVKVTDADEHVIV